MISTRPISSQRMQIHWLCIIDYRWTAYTSIHSWSCRWEKMTLVGIFPGTILMYSVHICLMVIMLFLNPDLCNTTIIMYYLVFKEVYIQKIHILVLLIRTEWQNSIKATTASLLASWKIYLTKLLTLSELCIWIINSAYPKWYFVDQECHNSWCSEHIKINLFLS